MGRSQCSLLVMQCSAGSRRFLMSPCSTERTEGRCTSCRTKRWDCGETQGGGGAEPRPQPPPLAPSTPAVTHAAAGSDSDLDGVPARLADVLQVERLVGGLVVTALDGERRGVDADLDGGRPVGVHLPVLVVVTLELQLQVGPGRAGRDVATREPPRHAAPRSAKPYVMHHCARCHCAVTRTTARTAPWRAKAHRPHTTAPHGTVTNHAGYHHAAWHSAVPRHVPTTPCRAPPRIQLRTVLRRAGCQCTTQRRVPC